MTGNSLDDLLDRSAPAVRRVSDRNLELMITDARALTALRRRPQVFIAGGAAAALLVAGVGTAAATDGFSWAPWAQDPLGAVPFTMDNGFACEIRFTEYTGGADPAFVGEVNGVLRDWYRTGNVIGDVEALVPGARQNVDLNEVELVPGETAESLPPGEAEHRAWAREWIAWDDAISEAEWDELARRGIEPDDPRMASSERSGQIQCLDENSEPYVPGAGS